MDIAGERTGPHSQRVLPARPAWGHITFTTADSGAMGSMAHGL